MVDTHVHLWANDFERYPLSSEFRPSDLLRPAYGPEDLLRDTAGTGVDRFVLVQMSYYGYDNRYMLDVLRSDPARFRGIAIVDPGGANPDAAMRELLPHGVVGFRIYMESTHPQALAGHAGYEKMFRCAAEQRLAICPLIDPHRLPDLAQQCARFPDTPVIVDHLARIGMKWPADDNDIRALCSLAVYPEVRVKLSGFYALGECRPPHTELAPFIRRVYDAFGPRRLVWGSDAPFQLMRESYEDSLALIRERLEFLSVEDREWVLDRTAREFFFGARATA